MGNPTKWPETGYPEDLPDTGYLAVYPVIKNRIPNIQQKSMSSHRISGPTVVSIVNRSLDIRIRFFKN